jgi:hypothetical protein
VSLKNIKAITIDPMIIIPGRTYISLYCEEKAIMIVTPFVQVGTYPTRNFATLGQ